MDDLLDGFAIPEQQIVEQAEDLLTFDDPGKLDKKPEEPWDPCAGW